MENNSKAKHILFGTLFVVQMYRWGTEDNHNYTAGIFDNEADAKVCGVAENIWRGGKYEPTIYQHNLNKWRNGPKTAMYTEIKENYPNTDIKDLWQKKRCWEDRQLEEEPEKYFDFKAKEMQRKTEEAKVLREYWDNKEKDKT